MRYAFGHFTDDEAGAAVPDENDRFVLGGSNRGNLIRPSLERLFCRGVLTGDHVVQIGCQNAMSGSLKQRHDLRPTPTTVPRSSNEYVDSHSTPFLAYVGVSWSCLVTV